MPVAVFSADAINPAGSTVGESHELHSTGRANESQANTSETYTEGRTASAKGGTAQLPAASVKEPEGTTINDVLKGNPIKLTITKEAPAADLPDVSGAYSLDRAVKVGLENNLDIHQLNSATKVAAFKARSALGRLGPRISFNPFYTTSSLSQMSFYPNDGLGLLDTPMQPIVKGTSLSLIFSAMQPLFTGGALVGNYRVFKAIQKQSLSAYQANRIEAARKIKEAYWKAAWNEARLRVDSDYVKYRVWSTSNMKAKMEQGKVARAYYLREEAELSKARTQVNQDYRDFNIALIDLKAVMGVNLASVMDLTDPFSFTDVQGDLSGYMKSAAINRPEIMQAASKVNEMKARKMIARSAYMPHVDLWGLGSNITGSSPNGNAQGRWGGVVGIAGHYTIFDSGQRMGEFRAANAAIAQADFASRQVQLQVAADVATAWVDLDLTRRNVDLAKAEVTSAAEDYRLLHSRYLIGKAIALEEFDAAVKLFQARLSLIEAIYQYRLSQARLEWAAGRI